MLTATVQSTFGHGTCLPWNPVYAEQASMNHTMRRYQNGY